MKTYLARAFAVSVLVLGASGAEAQYGRRPADGFSPGETLYGLNWEVSAPIGDFKNSFISDWGLRGFSGEGRYMLPQGISVGASFSWNRWSQEWSNLQVDVPNGNISGPVYRYADMFALRFLVHYYFTQSAIQPYVGAGIGGVWAYSYQQIVDLGWSQDSFNFIVDPELGVLVKLMPGNTALHLNLAVRYTYTTASVLKKSGSSIQWLTLPVVGLAWSY